MSESSLEVQPVHAHPNECPYIERDTAPDPVMNKAVPFQSNGYTYVYYRHINPVGRDANVQFCKICGRKKDVFQCLNVREWTQCPHYTDAQTRKSLQLVLKHPRLHKAENVREVLCLATLIASETLPATATITDSDNYFEAAVELDCDYCKLHDTCLAYLISA